MSDAVVIPRIRPRWRLHRPQAYQERIPRLPPVVATVLAARGIISRDQADTFYKPHLAQDHDPTLLPGMVDAVARTRRAIAAGETIALFGDFNVDGVTSVAVLHLGLQALGARTIRYIPDRFREGYGLNVGAVERLAGDGASLLITADCGTSSIIEVDAANRLGMDTIILDHHTVPERLPAALAVVNPKRPDSPYPFSELAAVGVSYRFLQALYDASGRDLPEDDYIDLVALGTVVDVAPLVDENRQIVVRGLERVRRAPRPGIAALATVAGVRPDSLGADSFGFALGPRMNAAGRLAHADLALDLLLAESSARARALAEQLNDLNRRRREQCEAAHARAEELCGHSDDPLIMVGAPDIHAGIVGIVAARLAESRHRPAIVYEQGPVESRASCRTIPEFDIVTAIRSEKELLVRHGGHRAAAGFTIRNENIAIFRDRLMNYAAEHLDGHELRPVIDIDAEAPLRALTGLEIKGLSRFEPCGEGNQRPVLLSRRVELRDWKRLGADERHLRVRVKDGPVTWPAIAFRQGDAELAPEVDIVYTLGRDLNGGVELEILDLAPSDEGHPVEFGT
ncbi:MAG: single-stranded-DNA-specific exonuclease RecJ [Dehalococcoidia bacterium]